MDESIEITQDSIVTDIEIEELRSSVGWENLTCPFSELKEKLYTYFAARKDGKLIGFINVLSDGVADAYLQDLTVHPDYQKIGIGTELVNRAINYLKSQNIKAIRVTFVPRLTKFYKRFGFNIIQAGIIDRDAYESSGERNIDRNKEKS
jgi:GNAT superfamily N-acetyltransferase